MLRTSIFFFLTSKISYIQTPPNNSIIYPLVPLLLTFTFKISPFTKIPNSLSKHQVPSNQSKFNPAIFFFFFPNQTAISPYSKFRTSCTKKRDGRFVSGSSTFFPPCPPFLVLSVSRPRNVFVPLLNVAQR